MLRKSEKSVVLLLQQDHPWRQTDINFDHITRHKLTVHFRGFYLQCIVEYWDSRMKGAGIYEIKTQG